MSRLYISATRKSSGKTTLAMGLCAALRRRGHVVRPFKKGPDYIDPMWLARASGNPCINLDFNAMTDDEVLQSFCKYSTAQGINVIEGNKGLFDGLDLHGSDSNAALAKLLQAPVILVVDGEGMTRGIAPLIQGYVSFERDLKISGLILNNLGGARHESKLRKIVEHYTDLELLGALQRNSELRIVERHLGLTTDREDPRSDEHIDITAGEVESQIDIERLIQISQEAPALSVSPASLELQNSVDLSIGVARDNAFCFYYADDIAAMEARGARIHYFDTLNDAGLPKVDAVFIGGGFPETHARQLEENRSMKEAIREFVASGKPLYAECGGLMYLARQISWRGNTNRMAGVIPADIEVYERPIGRGYVVLQPTADHPWYAGNSDRVDAQIKAHEFHYSSLTNLDQNLSFAYRVHRGHGIDGEHDGIIYNNVFASYAHMHHSAANPWVDGFLNSVQLGLKGSTNMLGQTRTASA